MKKHDASDFSMRELFAALRRDLENGRLGAGEIDSVFRAVEFFSDRNIRRGVLLLCIDLCSFSPGLVPAALKRIRYASFHLGPEDLLKWLGRSSEVLDSSGIKDFVDFITRVGEQDLGPYLSHPKLRFADASPVLKIYLQGISGKNIALAPDRDSSTDKETVFLPYGISRYESREGNLFLYVLMAAYCWSQIETGLLDPGRDAAGESGAGSIGRRPSGFAALLNSFPEKDLALDLYTILGAFMLETFLEKELPGLVNRAKPLKAELFDERPSLDELPEKTAFVEGICQYFLSGRMKGEMPQLNDYLVRLEELRRASSPKRVVGALLFFYGIASALAGEYNPVEPIAFLGRIRPEQLLNRQQAEREASLKEIERILADLREKSEPGGSEKEIRTVYDPDVDPERDYLIKEDSAIELDGDMTEILKREGNLAGWKTVKGSDLDKEEIFRLEDPVRDMELPEEVRAIKYDEWDFRTGEYRRQWCSVYERDVFPGDESFVESTLKQFGRYVWDLKRAFELLRPNPKMARRQKDGENPDHDALTDVYSDFMAGLAPEDEKIYYRMERTERETAVLFLIDMSNSTRGWINQAEKESLVLMCEALESLGDRYAIFGFNGTSRARCNFYRIKGFDESYSRSVKERIAGIEAGKYTRMGPPVRHATAILRKVEARKKLLFILSDSKPEDIGTYKGDYAIEDTRKALMEAKEKGIYPFCVAIDKEAKSYIPHLYGDLNYIEIDDLKKLPDKMPRLYLRLAALSGL